MNQLRTHRLLQFTQLLPYDKVKQQRRKEDFASSSKVDNNKMNKKKTLHIDHCYNKMKE
jgi:hypothetical protein